MSERAKEIRTGHDGPAMEPAEPSAPYPLAHKTQTACYLPWVRVYVALRYTLPFPWGVETWAEVRETIPGLVKERDRIRRAGSTEARLTPSRDS